MNELIGTEKEYQAQRTIPNVNIHKMIFRCS